MQILIAFSSRHGTTRKAGEMLAGYFPDDSVVFCNLQRTPLPDIRPFDIVVLGGSIHAGFIQTEIRRLCESRHDLLLSKTLGLYLCFMDQVRAEENFDKAFPLFIREHASARGLFGGELLFEHMTWLERLIVSKFTHYRENVYQLRTEEIARFAHLLQSALSLTKAG